MKKIIVFISILCFIQLIHAQKRNANNVADSIIKTGREQFKRIGITEKELPQQVRENLVKEFAEAKLRNIFRVEKQKDITYEIHISQGNKLTVVVYGREGGIISKSEMHNLNMPEDERIIRRIGETKEMRELKNNRPKQEATPNK